MVEMALNQLADRHLVDLDEERRAAMVSNLRQPWQRISRCAGDKYRDFISMNSMNRMATL